MQANHQAHQDDLVPMHDEALGAYDDMGIIRMSIWKNPLDREYVLDLYVGGVQHGRAPRNRREKAGIVRYVIPPNGTMAIPSEFDRGVQDVREGVIVGGLGPHLIKTNTVDRPILHPALNALEAQRKAAQHRLDEEIEKGRSAAERMIEAQAEIVDLKRRLSGAETATRTGRRTATSPGSDTPPKERE